MQGIIRYPVQVPGGVVFVSEDDLWRVDVDGGVAHRVATMRGRPESLHASPDGSMVGFTSTEEGAREVYVWLHDTGEVRRLTFDGQVLRVAGWQQGRVVYASARGRPFARDWRLHSVDPEGGWSSALKLGPAVSIAWGPKGSVAIGRDRADLTIWRGYRGGRRGHLWLKAPGEKGFECIEPAHGLVTPLFVGSDLLAVADPEGIPQLVRRDSEQWVPLTQHPETHPVRHAQAAADGVLYVAGPDLHRWTPEGGAQSVPVTLRSSRPQRARHFVTAVRYLEEADANNDGAHAVLIARGKPFVLGWFEGIVRQLGERQGVRYQLARWLDGERLVWVSDAGGKERLEVFDAGETHSLDDLEGGRPVSVRVSDDGQVAVVIDHRGWLWTVPTDSSQATAVHRGARPAVSMTLSPDAQWLAYAVETGRPGGPTELRIRHLESEKEQSITTGRYRDFSPSFCPDGGLLYFLSNREFDPVYDRQTFDLGFPRGSRPYALVLSATATNPFRPAPGPLKRTPSKPLKDVPPTQIDLDGLELRVVRFPMAEAVYHDLVGVGGGRVLFSRSGVQGSSRRAMYTPGPGRAEKQLVQWDFDKQETTVLNPAVSEFGVSADRKTLWVRAGDRLRVAASHLDKSGRDEIKKNSGAAGRPSGFVNLARVRVEIDPAAEWQQMFRETVRLMQDHHWESIPEPNLHPFEEELERIAGRGELSDLLQRFQGSLGTSHAYEIGGDHRTPPAWLPACIGADVSWDAKAHCAVLDRVIAGEIEDPSRRSPLCEPGINLSPGARVLAVAGAAITATHTLDAALTHRAGMDLELDVEDDAGARVVVVRPLRSDRAIRYRDEVLQRRSLVHDLSAGRLGYVHIPNMGPTGFADFHRDYAIESALDGLVIDVRNNTGGHVSQLLLEKLLRKTVGWVVPRWGVPYGYPAHAVSGPMVAVTNAHAGSDGDIFSHLFKRYGLGPLVGTRTWGGTVGIRARHYLVDRSLVTQPEFANWYDDVEFGLENFGTEPTLEVREAPECEAAGDDPQLQAGVRLALDALATQSHPPRPSARR